MNLEKLKPWNWFKHEESSNGGSKPIPVSRTQAESLPGAGAGSLMSLHRDMDRWFEEAFKSFAMPPFPSMTGTAGDKLSGFYRPKIDVCGDSNCYEINLDVPGLAESDLSLEVKDNVLTIKGEKEERSEERTLSLPDDANADEIKANLDKGVLKLEIPRREVVEQDVKRISISS
jgi:HSP20 family protein